MKKQICVYSSQAEIFPGIRNTSLPAQFTSLQTTPSAQITFIFNIQTHTKYVTQTDIKKYDLLYNYYLKFTVSFRYTQLNLPLTKLWVIISLFPPQQIPYIFKMFQGDCTHNTSTCLCVYACLSVWVSVLKPALPPVYVFLFCLYCTALSWCFHAAWRFNRTCTQYLWVLLSSEAGFSRSCQPHSVYPSPNVSSAQF